MTTTTSAGSQSSPLTSQGTSSTAATVTSSSSFECPQSSGLFAFAGDCKQFWHCSNGMSYLKACPGQLVFNDVLGICDYTSRLCPSHNRRRRRRRQLPDGKRPRLQRAKRWLNSTTILMMMMMILKNSNLSKFKGVFVCPKSDGLFANINECATYWSCANNVATLLKCADELVFDENSGTCGKTSSTC